MFACAAAPSRRCGRLPPGGRASDKEHQGTLNRPSYGWVVVAAAFTLMFVGFGTAYSFAAFFTAFQSEFGAPRAHVALVFSVAAFIWFVIGAPGGMLADRFGPRRVTLCGVACLAAALWL